MLCSAMPTTVNSFEKKWLRPAAITELGDKGAGGFNTAGVSYLAGNPADNDFVSSIAEGTFDGELAQ